MTTTKWLKLKKTPAEGSVYTVRLGGGDYHFTSDPQGTMMPADLADGLLSSRPDLYEQCDSEWHRQKARERDEALLKDAMKTAPAAVKNVLKEKLGITEEKVEPAVPVVSRRKRG